MIVKFEEKHGARYVEGENWDVIAAYVLKDRIEDTMGYGLSVWYNEDTENAVRALNSGRAYDYIRSRAEAGHEYEDYRVVSAEYADAAEDYRIEV